MKYKPIIWIFMTGRMKKGLNEIWLASERKITSEQMSRVMERALDWKVIRAYFGTIDMNTEKGIKRFGNITLPIAPSQISVRSIAIRRSILCSAISTISR